MPLALLLAVLLAGCSTWPAWMQSSSNEAARHEKLSMQPDSIDGVLRFLSGALVLPDDKQTSIYQTARQQYRAHRTAAARLRFALLATFLPPPARDAAQARSLLAGYSWRTTRPGYASLARVALHVLDSRDRTAKATTKLQKALETAHQNNGHLQKQLNALKAIEQSLGSRNPENENDG